MNKLHHSDFVAVLASIYRPKTYLELGLYQGETFNKVANQIKQSRRIGVDIKPVQINGENFVCTTDEFFKSFEDTVDMVFIDADHKFESALRDFDSSLQILNPGGCILIHDTDPEDDKLFSSGYCGDSYKIVDLLEKREDLNIVTIPCQEAGISVVTKKADTRTERRKNDRLANK